MTDTITKKTMEGLTTTLLSETEDERLIKYALDIARNPDPGSEIEKNTKSIRNLPDEAYLKILLDQNFDSLIYHNDIILGRVSFQEHKNELTESYNWHVFDVYIEKDHRNNGHGTELVKKLIISSQENEIQALKIGKPKPKNKMTDGEKALKHIIYKLKQEEDNLSIIVCPDLNTIYNRYSKTL